MKLITNNPLVRDHFTGMDGFQVEFIDVLGYMDVLKRARDEIHLGQVLLTHPLSGSVKPNETPYKSVAVGSESLHDIDSLWLIENAIETYLKFEKNKTMPKWSQQVREDFMVVDFDLIRNALIR